MNLPLRLALALGFSGFAAVLYEVLWVRILGDLFGHTAFAIQVVLTVFFAGLALGSLVSDRLTKAGISSLRVYAAVELALAALALAFPALVEAVTPLYDRLAPLDLAGTPALAARVTTAAALLLAPTALMGATFPLIVRGAQSADIPSLYAINTLGGAGGGWLSAFVLLPLLGVSATLAVGALANLLAAALVFTLKPDASEPERPPPAGAPRSRVVLPTGVLRTLLFATGFVALGLEVLWARALDQVLSGTVYSFATVLAVFLAGIGLGGVVARRLLRQWDPVTTFVGLELVLAGYVVASLFFLRAIPEAAAQLETGLGAGFLRRGFVLESLLAGLVLLVPAVCMGIVFPLLLEMDRPQGLRAVGSLLAGNTLGALLGPLVAGTLLLPRLGLGRSLLVLAVLAWTASAAVLVRVRAGPRAALGASLIVVGVLMVLAPRTLLLGVGPGERVLEVREDPAATVAVVESRGAVPERRLKINRSFSLGGGAGVFTERRQGHLPMLLHPDPQRVLVLGVGTGNTLGAVALHRPRALTAVELVAGVLALARRHFEGSNEAVLRRPGVRVLCADARRVARSSQAKYDLVIADLFHPWQAGVGGLYSREHFLAVRRTLAPGGVFCQWLPLYQVSTHDLRTVVRTFLDAYPHAEAWLGNFGSTTPVLALCGSEIPVRLQWDRWRQAVADAELRARLEAVYLDRPAEVYGGYVGNHATLTRFAGPGPMNTVDRPTIEFSAPRVLFSGGLEQEKRRSLTELIALAPPTVPLAGGPGSPGGSAVARNLESVRHLIGAFLAREAGDLSGALRHARRSVERAEGYDVPAKGLVALAWEASDTRPWEAEAAFREALVLQPRDENALTGLGMACLSQKRWDEASRAFRGALAVRPDWPEALEGLRKVESLRDAP